MSIITKIMSLRSYKRRPPKPTPTLEGFIEFAKTQSGAYDFSNYRTCAFGQYIRSLGYSGDLVSYKDVYTYKLDGAKTFSMNDLHPMTKSAIIGFGEGDMYWEDLVRRLSQIEKV